nr:ORF1 [Torque teno mustelid virus 2]
MVFLRQLEVPRTGMAWRFRRWRWRRRRRPAYRGYRRSIRPGFRRRTRKVRRKRRRYPKRRLKKKAIQQWQPSHVRRCIISGWHIGMWGTKPTLAYPFQGWVAGQGDKPGHFTIYEGGASLWHITLGHLYEEFVKGRNRWSTSNEGFDLANYFGTKLILYPHPLYNYIVWWERDFGEISPAQYKHSHPARALLEKNHVVVLSIPQGGRKRKKIWIPPPSTFTSTWTFMNKWCNIPLFRFGISLLNTTNPFIHKGKLTPQVPCGTYNGDTSNVSNPDKLPTVAYPESNENIAYYNWSWDDGQDNKIGVKDDETSDRGEAIYHLSIPYWVEFYGAGSDYISSGKKVYIWWWKDKNLYTDPHQIPSTEKKQWIKLGHTMGHLPLPLNGWGNIAQHGPFVYAQGDLGGEGQFSFFFRYKSYWKWGGIHPTPAANLDPCTVSPNSDDLAPVQIRNPARARRAALHPWDLDFDGFITKEKLREIIGFSPKAVRGLPQYLPEPRPRKRRSPSPETEDSGTDEEPPVRRRRSDSERPQPSAFYFEEDTLPPVQELQGTTEEKLGVLIEQFSRDREQRRKLRRRIRRFLRD